MTLDAFIPILEVAGPALAARVLWWMLDDLVLDRLDLSRLWIR
jgi:hypothetical protein